MIATCFPYGFPTGHSRVYPALGRLWPRSVNSEPGTSGHECGQPATFVCVNAASGLQACFCAAFKEGGHEARRFGDWHELEPAGQGAA
jgi:hypothetical protein